MHKRNRVDTPIHTTTETITNTGIQSQRHSNFRHLEGSQPKKAQQAQQRRKRKREQRILPSLVPTTSFVVEEDRAIATLETFTFGSWWQPTNKFTWDSPKSKRCWWPERLWMRFTRRVEDFWQKISIRACFTTLGCPGVSRKHHKVSSQTLYALKKMFCSCAI